MYKINTHNISGVVMNGCNDQLCVMYVCILRLIIVFIHVKSKLLNHEVHFSCSGKEIYCIRGKVNPSVIVEKPLYTNKVRVLKPLLSEGSIWSYLLQNEIESTVTVDSER